MLNGGRGNWLRQNGEQLDQGQQLEYGAARRGQRVEWPNIARNHFRLSPNGIAKMNVKRKNKEKFIELNLQYFFTKNSKILISIKIVLLAHLPIISIINYNSGSWWDKRVPQPTAWACQSQSPQSQYCTRLSPGQSGRSPAGPSWCSSCSRPSNSRGLSRPSTSGCPSQSVGWHARPRSWPCSSAGTRPSCSSRSHRTHPCRPPPGHWRESRFGCWRHPHCCLASSQWKKLKE